MDLTTTAAAATAAPNSLDKENEAPPATTQSNKSLSFTNGALRKQSQNHQPPQPVAAVVAYRECLKNHAASLGGHAVDGCGEFMASPTSNPTDPTSLKCAACGCHRNFHRRDDDLALTPTAVTTHFLDFHRHPPPPPPRRSSPFSSPSPPPPHHPSHFASATHMLLALSSDTHPAVVTPATPTAAKAQNPSGRKRFRTKFSQDQKEKMFSFSEKLGWKLQKSDEGIVDQFCSEIGVGKGVLKVWMHNNKHTFPKKESNSTSNNSNHGHNHHDDSNNGVHLQASANGSPSSA